MTALVAPSGECLRLKASYGWLGQWCVR